MIFHEIYSAYYNAVAKILSALIQEERTEKELQSIVTAYAFEESVLTILPALKSGRWQLVTRDFGTPLKHEPTMPLTTLQKRWLKAISLDRRFRLFGVTLRGLEDVEPLFLPEDYTVYDQYADGDPYEDEGYIERFRIILAAIRTGSPLKIEMKSRSGETAYRRCIPKGLEYSQKDDKFRMRTSGKRYGCVINLDRITKCRPYQGEKCTPFSARAPRYDVLTLEIRDERNAMERVMLHFAHFEKRAECVGKRLYRLYITYDKDDEAEMVIRVLSFGPMVRVLGPENLLDSVKEKLKKQKSCGLL